MFSDLQCTIFFKKVGVYMAWDFTVDSTIQLDLAKYLKEKADDLDTEIANLYTQIIARGYIDLNEEAIVQIRLLRAVEGFIADWIGISGGVMGQMRVKRG